jgi:hypothetical protein
MFWIVWRPTVAGVFDAYAFGVIPDFGKIFPISTPLGTKTNQIPDICNTILFWVEDHTFLPI